MTLDTSAVDLRARRLNDDDKPRPNNYLKESARGRVSIIAMDYLEKPQELVITLLRCPTTG
jgi:hypothetical protein